MKASEDPLQIKASICVGLRLEFPLNLARPSLLTYLSVVLTPEARLSLDILAAKEKIEIHWELEYSTVLLGVECPKARIQKHCRKNLDAQNGQRKMFPKAFIKAHTMHLKDSTSKLFGL